ncbi:MAG: nitroreductase family protein [archaeon]
MSDAIELIKSRRSVRKYKKQGVPDELVKKVLEAGLWAPSSNHSEPVEFIVVKDEKKRGELSKISAWSGFLKNAPVNIAVIAKDSECIVEDGSVAVMCMMLEAHSLGLGTCWVECSKAQEFVKKALGIPDEYAVITVLPLGWPDEKKTSERKPLGASVHEEKY